MTDNTTAPPAVPMPTPAQVLTPAPAPAPTPIHMGAYNATCVTLQGAPPFWWDSSTGEPIQYIIIGLAAFVAALACSMLLLGSYTYLLTPRLRHAHWVAKLVGFLVTSGLSAGGCALFAAGIAVVSPTFMACISGAGLLFLNFLFAVCFKVRSQQRDKWRAVIVVGVMLACGALCFVVRREAFCEKQSQLFAAIKSAESVAFVICVAVFTVICGIGQWIVDKRIKSKMLHDNEGPRPGEYGSDDDFDDDDDINGTNTDTSRHEDNDNDEQDGSDSDGSARGAADNDRRESDSELEEGSTSEQRRRRRGDTTMQLDNVVALPNVFYAGLPMIAAVMGSLNILIATELFRLAYFVEETNGEDYQWNTTDTFIYVDLVLANLATNGLELFFIQKALQKFETTVVFTIFVCVFVICTFLGDMIMFQDQFFFEYEDEAYKYGLLALFFTALVASTGLFCSRRSSVRQTFTPGPAPVQSTTLPTTTLSQVVTLELQPAEARGVMQQHAEEEAEDREREAEASRRRKERFKNFLQSKEHRKKKAVEAAAEAAGVPDGKTSPRHDTYNRSFGGDVPATDGVVPGVVQMAEDSDSEELAADDGLSDDTGDAHNVSVDDVVLADDGSSDEEELAPELPIALDEDDESDDDDFGAHITAGAQSLSSSDEI